MKKKVLGLSFGRKMSNCEIMVKEALMTCEQQGCDVEFIRMLDLDIKDCTGCIACVIGLVSGRGKGECVLKDDFHILDEALMDSDALIVASPTYVLSPTGQFKTVCDRIGPSHDITFRQPAYDQGLADGKPADKLPDPRSFKPRVGALISVGGAVTKNWLSFMLPTMYELPMPMGIDIVDMVEYHGAMKFEHVVGNQPMMARMVQLGGNIAQAVQAETAEVRTRWRGEQEGACPVCHCDMLTILHDQNRVECPVCGIEGRLKLVDGQIRTTFSEAEQARSRLKDAGKLEHSTEIKTQAVGPGQIPNKAELLAKYKDYAAKR